jgi:hypothetical protein
LKSLNYHLIVSRLIVKLSLFLFCSCIDTYNIKSLSYRDSLVVDGFLSSQLKQHEVVISRASKISTGEFLPEQNAQVAIKEDDQIINLTEESPGIYLTPLMKGIVGNTYQLIIKTATGREIVSEPVLLKENPAIQNIYARYSTSVPSLEGKGGFEIFLNTGDSISSDPRYYRWEFEETWEIRTPFESNFLWLGGNNVVFRSEPVSQCYITKRVNNLTVQSTQSIGVDKIRAQLIQTIPKESRKLQALYSILVKQFTLSPKAYQYWQILKKTNQTQGSLYDTQPGAVYGNMNSTTDNEIVLGYFDASVVSEKRIFLEPLKFRPSGFSPTDWGTYCRAIEPRLVSKYLIGDFYADPANSNLEIWGSTQEILYLLPKECCDCTSIDNATTKKPIFWP